MIPEWRSNRSTTRTFLRGQYLAITAAGSCIRTIHILITFTHFPMLKSNNPPQDFIDHMFEFILNDAMTDLLMRDVSHIDDDDEEQEIQRLMQER